MSAISRVSNPMNCVQVMRRPFGTRPLSLRSPPHLMFLMTILIFDETWCLTFSCQEVRGREGQGQGPSEGVQISEAVATASFPRIWAARCAQATKASLAKTICWTCSFCLHLRRQCGPKMLAWGPYFADFFFWTQDPSTFFLHTWGFRQPAEPAQLGSRQSRFQGDDFGNCRDVPSVQFFCCLQLNFSCCWMDLEDLGSRATSGLESSFKKF